MQTEAALILHLDADERWALLGCEGGPTTSAATVTTTSAFCVLGNTRGAVEPRPTDVSLAMAMGAHP